MKPTTTDTRPEKLVSILPEDMTGGRRARRTSSPDQTDSLVKNLQAFAAAEQTAAAERKSFSGVPQRLKLLIEVLAAAASPDSEIWSSGSRGKRRISMDVTGAYLLTVGLPRLDKIPGVHDVMKGRHVAAAIGSQELAWHSSTFYCELAADGPRVKLQLRLPSDLQRDMATFSTAIGLPPGKVAALCLALALLDAPVSTDDRTYLAELVVAFGERARDRAAEVAHRVVRRVNPSSRRRSQTYASLLEQLQKESNQ